MKASDWNCIARQYAEIDDTRRDGVYKFIRSVLKDLKPESMLDYGGGDGQFALACTNLPIKSIVTYDPSTEVSAVARKICAPARQVEVVESVVGFDASSFDIVTLNAVWMCLSTREICLKTLRDILRLLKPGGLLIASVTHPCFRNIKFSTFEANFDLKSYFRNGKQFRVRIFDDSREIYVTDTHWNLEAMSSQLSEVGFMIEKLVELPDTKKQRPAMGSPWLIIFARQK